MSRYTIEEKTLTSIADAIRAKTGKSGRMTPALMVNEIAGIESGAGNDFINSIIDRTITEIESDASVIGAYCFGMCSHLLKGSFPNVTEINAGGFISCESLKELHAPQAEKLHPYALSGCGSLLRLDFNNLTLIDTFALGFTVALKTLIIRTPGVCLLRDADSLSGSGISLGTGYVYVPRSLVYQYKHAENWTAYAGQIRAIEDYPEITEI